MGPARGVRARARVGGPRHAACRAPGRSTPTCSRRRNGKAQGIRDLLRLKRQQEGGLRARDDAIAAAASRHLPCGGGVSVRGRRPGGVGAPGLAAAALWRVPRQGVGLRHARATATLAGAALGARRGVAGVPDAPSGMPHLWRPGRAGFVGRARQSLHRRLRRDGGLPRAAHRPNGGDPSSSG